jgi:hypothetical protein
MKKLILFTLLLLSFLGYSQDKNIEYLGYIPLRTYHWNRNIELLNKLHSTEGGNLGIILIRRINYKDKLYTEKQLGIIRNSYGDASIIINQGFGYRLNNLNIGLSIGLATGYEKSFRGTAYSTINPVTKEIKFSHYSKSSSSLPGIFINNGIMPIILINISMEDCIKIGKLNISPLINISPEFINGGIIVNFTNL